jgi:SAM-dependent methyltransferase
MSVDDRVPATEHFDAYAEDYDAVLNQGLAVTGEGKDFFARERILWVSRCLGKLAVRPARILDYGCGTGSATPFLRELLHSESTIGVDTSEESLEVAQRTHRASSSRFLRNDQYKPEADIDLAYCNGVFHHIQPPARPVELNYIRDCLRPGGLFALWENNPWNPGTRYVMSRIPFDRDAITLTHLEARRLLRQAGFEIVRTDFLFIFPGWLKLLRRVEKSLSRMPLGGQYQILCRRPLETSEMVCVSSYLPTPSDRKEYGESLGGFSSG